MPVTILVATLQGHKCYHSDYDWLENEEDGEEKKWEGNTNKLAILEEKEDNILESTLSSESEEVAHIVGNI